MSSFEQRLDTYMRKYQRTIVRGLGAGTQGNVFLCHILSQSSRNNDRVAVKFHHREPAYRRERDVYQRLSELEVMEVAGHMVPQLVTFDSELWTIEMTIVSPPFCLDFGGAYLDQPPDYSEEVWADWRQQKAEAFESNWSKVEEILAEFRTMGIYIADVNPGNIRF